MRFSKYKMSPMNEALYGNCNIEDSDEVGIIAAVDPTYAKAIKDRKVRKKKAEDAFKDSEKLHKDFVADNHKREVKTETTKEMKAMKLAEDVKVESPAVEGEDLEVTPTETSTEPLTEAIDFGNPLEMGRGACTPLAPNYSDQIRNYVKHYGENAHEDKFIVKSLKRFLQALFDAKDTAAAFNDYWTNRYPAMLKYIDDQINLIPAEIVDDTMMEPAQESLHEKKLAPLTNDNLAKVEDPMDDFRKKNAEWQKANRKKMGAMLPGDDDDIEGLEEFLDANISLDASGSSVGFLGGTAGTVKNEMLDLNVGLDASGSSVGFLNGKGGEVINASLEEAEDKNFIDYYDIEDHPDIDKEYTATYVYADGNVSKSAWNWADFMTYTTQEYDKHGLQDSSVVSLTVTDDETGETVRKYNQEGIKENIDPHFFAVEEEVLTEAPVATEPKKRARAENEVKYQRDYSSEDLWLAVYDELSSDLDNEGPGQQVNKQIKAKRGERYENVYPHGDSDIIIYATDPSEFEFARKVAQHYGVTCREPVEDTNPSTNGHYKWSMVIEIPEDELFDSAFKPLHKDDEF